MNLRRIKHALFRLSNEEKMVGGGALLVLFSTFLPWYSVVFNFNEEGLTQSGFSGDLGVIGFVTFLLTGMALVTLVADNFSFKLPNFGYKKEQIILFLMGESAFLLLLTLAVYTKRSFDYTNAEIRFGLMLALLGAVMGSFAIYAQTQKKEKRNVEAFFSHEEEEVAQKEVGAQDLASTEKSEEITEKKVPEKTANKGKYFYETPAETAETSKDAVETEDIQPTKEPEQETFFPEESTKTDTEPSAEVVEEEIDLEIQDEPIETTKTDPESQGDFFTREAGVKSASKPRPGIKVDIDSIKRVDEPEAPTADKGVATEASLSAVASAEVEAKEVETNESKEKKEQISNSGFYSDI